MSDKVKGYTALAVVAGGLGGLVYCGLECSSPYNYISDGTLGLIAVGTLAAFYVFVEAMSQHGLIASA